jgi:hypothetical protein
MHPRRGDGDADLAGAGYGIVDLFEDEVLGGAEGVQTDGVHEESPESARLLPRVVWRGSGTHSSTSSLLEVKGL